MRGDCTIGLVVPFANRYGAGRRSGDVSGVRFIARGVGCDRSRRLATIAPGTGSFRPRNIRKQGVAAIMVIGTSLTSIAARTLTTSLLANLGERQACR